MLRRPLTEVFSHGAPERRANEARRPIEFSTALCEPDPRRMDETASRVKVMVVEDVPEVAKAI
ncbi:MAG TPA: hypothetical protein VF469_31910, partial [Kofleriaceae bacterium]